MRWERGKKDLDESDELENICKVQSDVNVVYASLAECPGRMSASDVQRVEFWSNGAVIRILDRPPFRLTIGEADVGSYGIHAVAYTAHGKLASQQVYVGVQMREEDRMHELTVEEGTHRRG